MITDCEECVESGSKLTTLYGVWLLRGRLKRNDGRGVFGWVRIMRIPMNVADEYTTGYNIQYGTRYKAQGAAKFATIADAEAFAVLLLAKHPFLIGKVEIREFGTYGASSVIPNLGSRDLSGTCPC